MANADSDSEPEELSMFTEPADYFPPSPKPTTETHTLLSGRVLTLHLVGHNPLWGHHLWQAGRIISDHLEKNPSLIAGKTVLELGAGAGLPSLTCAALGATRVLCTDYPDQDLIVNIRKNIDEFEEGLQKEERGRVHAEGYCWGADPSKLLGFVQDSEANDKRFDILILADLLFNHSEHTKLLSTVQSSLSKEKGSKALVFFTPYRPWLYEKDMAFFDLVRAEGMRVEKVLEEKMEKVMFEEDRGDEELRRTVFGFEVTWE